MSAVAFSRLAGTVFVLVAFAHLYRLFSHAPVQLGSLSVPQWVSWLAFVGAGSLGFLGIRARA